MTGSSDPTAQKEWDILARALREAREVCERVHAGYWGTPVLREIPPAECECCRRIAAALLRAEARGVRPAENNPGRLAVSDELLAAAARLSGEGQRG